MSKPKRKKTTDRDRQWAEAKKRCRLNRQDVSMAKELGLHPRTLIENIPSPKQKWKAPVKIWIRELHEKRFGPSEICTPAGETSPERVAEGGVEETFSEDALSEDHLIDDGPWEEPYRPPTDDEIAEQDRYMLGRQAAFRRAAQYVAASFGTVPGVEKVTLFGSVAAPLHRDVPRFRAFKRSRTKILHECKDVDIAVHLSDLTQLPRLRKLRSRAVRELFAAEQLGVAHHQVDVFVLEPGTDRYLGRLCTFARCPADKPDCDVPGCGASPFLRQHVDFTFDPGALSGPDVETLFHAPGEDGIPF